MTAPALSALTWLLVYFAAIQVLLTAFQAGLILVLLISFGKEVRDMNQQIENLRLAAVAIADDAVQVRDLVVVLRQTIADLQEQIATGNPDAAAIAEISQILTDADSSLDAITTGTAPPAMAGGPAPATSPETAGAAAAETRGVIEIAQANEERRHSAGSTGGGAVVESGNPPGTVKSESGGLT